jgi:hypothetical protein
MKSKKAYYIKSVMFMLTLLIFLPGIQGIKQEGIPFSGVIESIDKDFKFIVINGAKILISENTKIVDEKGNILKKDDLKLKLPVVIEGVRSPEGFLAKKVKILIPTPKKKP